MSDNYREKTNKSTDAKIFKRTAVKTKKINVSPKISRGGIRLWYSIYIALKTN